MTWRIIFMKKNEIMEELLDMYDEYVKVNKHGLNVKLAISKGISLEDFKSLQDLYEVAEGFIEQLESEVDVEQTLDRLTETEFLIQDAWGFSKNEDYHYFSFRPKNCLCPKLDNMDRIGTRYRVYNSICPIHNIKTMGD